jgi:hypothetical protein
MVFCWWLPEWIPRWVNSLKRTILLVDEERSNVEEKNTVGLRSHAANDVDSVVDLGRRSSRVHPSPRN